MLKIENISVGILSDGTAMPIVRDVSLSIAQGEALGVVGESGSGKSLTAQSVARMYQSPLTILGGRVELDGIDLTKLSERELHALRGKAVSYVFQDPLNALNPTRTIGQHLLDVIRRHTPEGPREARSRAVEVLRSVGITQPEERMRAYPHQLSGGMRQRVLIAMGLVCVPKLLIADEPTTALDVTVQARIIDLFRDIQRRGISLLFISHNLDLVLEFCDSVAVMYGGRVVERGTAEEIGREARHPYTAALMSCIPRIENKTETLKVIPGSPPVGIDKVQGCPFAARCERVQDQCWQEMPPIERLSETHELSCWNPIPGGRAN
uniref:ABC transporter ATP-binding protein n=1 Tax=Aminobacter niigataensis TaxID=83265 RepID=UPI00285260C4|nr:ABC transporter ATP-binding protein [Aminobacter niigataensis]WMD00122.1 ABC transporter ATP-binding protein [Aminobacter niigataensis]